MGNKMIVENLKTPQFKKIIIEQARKKASKIIQEVKEQIKDIKDIDETCNFEKNDFNSIEKLYQKRKIRSPEFDKRSIYHSYRICSLDIKKIAIKTKLETKMSVLDRINCLILILSIPPGKNEITRTKKDGTTETVTKEQLYMEYFQIVFSTEKNRLLNEENYLRLQLNLNKKFSTFIDSGHEFYGDIKTVEKKLEDKKIEIYTLNQQEKELYNISINQLNFKQLTIEDFFSDNTLELFNRFLTPSEEQKKAI